MSNVYCSQCGTKHMLGAKFCSSCGTPMGGQILGQSRPTVSRNVRSAEVDEDGLPTTFTKPRKLEYEVEKNGRNKFSVNEIISQKPSSEKFQRPIGQSKILSQEEYLAQSLKECQSSRNFEDVNEA